MPKYGGLPNHYAKNQRTDVGLAGHIRLQISNAAVSSASSTPVGKSAHAVQFSIGLL